MKKKILDYSLHMCLHVAPKFSLVKVNPNILITFNFYCYKCGAYHLGYAYWISLLGNHLYVRKMWTTYVLCHLFKYTFAIYRLRYFFF